MSPAKKESQTELGVIRKALNDAKENLWTAEKMKHTPVSLPSLVCSVVSQRWALAQSEELLERHIQRLGTDARVVDDLMDDARRALPRGGAGNKSPNTKAWNEYRAQQGIEQ